MTLPVLWPALLAAIIYEFSSSMESFEAPLVVGLPGNVYVYSTMIYISTREPLPNYGLGATFATSYVLMAVALAYFYQRAILLQNERFTTVTGKGFRPRIMALGRWRYPALGLFVRLFLSSPLCFRSACSSGPLCCRLTSRRRWKRSRKLSWNNYRLVFNEPHVLRTAWNTIVITVITATATVASAFSVSWLVVRTKVRGRFAPRWAHLRLSCNPGVVVALSFIILYLQPPFRYLGLYGTIWIVSLALITQYVAFASRTTNAAITQIHRELEEAGEVSGARRLQNRLANYLSTDPARFRRRLDLGCGSRRQGFLYSAALGEPGKSHVWRSCSGTTGMRKQTSRPPRLWESCSFCF